MTRTEAYRARWAVAGLFLSAGVVTGAWAPQIPLLLPRHQIGEATLGLLILVLGLGAVTAMLFSGRLIARFGSVPVVSGFSLAVIAVLPLIVYAPNLWLLAPAMALFGAVAGCMDVAMNANAVEVERRLGRAIMSSSHGFWSLGAFLGGISGSWLIAHLAAGTAALLGAASVALLVGLALPFLRGEPPHSAERRAETGPVALIPRVAGVWILGAMTLASMVPEGAALDWAALYLQQELAADTFRSGLGFAFFAGAMALMRFMGDSLRNRFGAVTTLRASGLIGAAGLMIAAFSPTSGLAIAGFALSGLGVANMVPILFSAAGNYPGLVGSAALSTVTMVGYAGILVAPSSIGFVAEAVGFRPTYAALSLLLLVVALMARRAVLADMRED